MKTSIAAQLAGLFGELVDGANQPSVAYILNTGDRGLLQSLETRPRLTRHRRRMAARQSPLTRSTCATACGVGHLAYHMGAIRQISKATRGPGEGTFN
jgi:hypothetical protein